MQQIAHVTTVLPTCSVLAKSVTVSVAV